MIVAPKPEPMNISTPADSSPVAVSPEASTQPLANSASVNSAATIQSAATSPLTSQEFEELEGGVVDLLCQLEHLLSVVKETDPADRSEVFVESSEKMLTVMLDFTEAFYSGESLEKTNGEISAAFMSCQLLNELTANVSIGGLLLRTFGGTDPNQAVIDDTSNELRRTLKRAIVTLLYHAIQMAGFDTPLGKQLDQSTVLFVAELESAKLSQSK